MKPKLNVYFKKKKTQYELETDEWATNPKIIWNMLTLSAYALQIEIEKTKICKNHSLKLKLQTPNMNQKTQTFNNREHD